MSILCVGDKVRYGGRTGIVTAVAPRFNKHGSEYIDYHKGATVDFGDDMQTWCYQSNLTVVNPEYKSTLKNKVEIKGDIALIYIQSKGREEIAIVDKLDIPRIELACKNRLNIDTGGHVQHRQFIDGEYEVFQLHRFLAYADDSEIVGFKNGNKLDLRFKNLNWKQR